MRIRGLQALGILALASVSVGAQTVQYVQGPDLLGSGASVGQGFQASLQGYAVAISADGSTAIVGGPYDTNATGAAWIWAKGSDGTWSQQGSKLVGSGAFSGVQSASSVSLSADGNTAAVGGVGNTQNLGVVWIWIRNNGVWTQQGSALTTGSDAQGGSVSLSADGNTLATAGGTLVSVWTRSDGVWSQQGSTLTPPGVSPPYSVGAVAISPDGQTLAMGVAASASIFTVSGGVWTQQGPALTAQDGTYEGFDEAFSFSADGNTLLIGGYGGGNVSGVGWVFTRSNGTWTQTAELSGPGANPDASVGASVALSSDGKTAVVGADNDNSLTGAVFVFQNVGNSWTQAAKLTVANSGALGKSVGVSGDGMTVIAGGPYTNSWNSGAWAAPSCCPATTPLCTKRMSRISCSATSQPATRNTTWSNP